MFFFKKNIAKKTVIKENKICKKNEIKETNVNKSPITFPTFPNLSSNENKKVEENKHEHTSSMTTTQKQEDMEEETSSEINGSPERCQSKTPPVMTKENHGENKKISVTELFYYPPRSAEIKIPS